MKRAARLLGAATRLRARIGSVWPVPESQAVERTVNQVRAALGEAGWAAAYASREVLSLPDAIAEALAT